MKKLQLKYSTPKIKLNSVKKLCENKDNSSNIKNCATCSTMQTVEKPRFASKSGLNLCQIMPLNGNYAQ